MLLLCFSPQDTKLHTFILTRTCSQIMTTGNIQSGLATPYVNALLTVTIAIYALVLYDRVYDRLFTMPLRQALHCPHLPDKETEAQTGYSACPRSHGRE